jgi:hypothetical protein
LKIPRSYIGKEVRLTWRDPISTVERFDVDKVPKGLDALATWVERGVIDDITEGVIRFRMSEGYSGAVVDSLHLDEATYGWIPEDLIVKCELGVFSEQKES